MANNQHSLLGFEHSFTIVGIAQSGEIATKVLTRSESLSVACHHDATIQVYHSGPRLRGTNGCLVVREFFFLNSPPMTRFSHGSGYDS
jgi:hypothetical protein